MIFEQKNQKMHKSSIMNVCLIILATNTIFIDLLRITLPKLHIKLQPHPLKVYLSRGRKSAKNAKIMNNYADESLI